MIYGHRHQGVDYRIPAWAGKLNNLYWVIRNEGRNKTKRRMYYRYVSAEKLKLAEKGIEQELIEIVCRYLSNFNPQTGRKMQMMVNRPIIQLTLQY